MSIPWENIELKPMNQHKVDGQALLDLRAAKADLEMHVASITRELNKTKQSLAEVTERVAALEATKSENTTTINDLSSAKSLLEGTSTALKSANLTLEGQLAAATKKINELNAKVGELVTPAAKVRGLEEQIAAITKALADKQTALDEKAAALAAAIWCASGHTPQMRFVNSGISSTGRPTQNRSKPRSSGIWK